MIAQKKKKMEKYSNSPKTNETKKKIMCLVSSVVGARAKPHITHDFFYGCGKWKSIFVKDFCCAKIFYLKRARSKIMCVFYYILDLDAKNKDKQQKRKKCVTQLEGKNIIEYNKIITTSNIVKKLVFLPYDVFVSREYKFFSTGI